MFGFRRRRDVDTDVAYDRTETTDRAWGGPPLVRGVFTLLGVLVAGFLIWLATQFDLGDTAEFWAAMGILAGAGFVLGVSQLLGGWTKWGVPTMSPGVFLLGFLPALILGGGILLATRETGQGTQDTVAGWASDIGIEGFARDVSLFQGVIAFGIGLVFSFVFDTAGPRREHVVAQERETVVPDEDVDDYRTTRDEEIVREEETVPAGTTTTTGEPVVRDEDDRPVR
jgi:hypothetical protein